MYYISCYNMTLPGPYIVIMILKLESHDEIKLAIHLIVFK